MDAVKEENLEKKRMADWPWPVIASVVGAILLGIAYSSGDAYYRARLSSFWIDPDAFPIDKSRHFVLSAWSALNAAIAIEDWLGSHKEKLFWMVIFSLAYVGGCMVIFKILRWFLGNFLRRMFLRVGIIIFEILKICGARNFFRRLNVFLRKRRNGVRLYDRMWAGFRRYLVAGLKCIFVACGIIIIGVFFPTFISIPSAIGESVGNKIAGEERRDFDLGCEKSKSRCEILLKDGREVARGYVVVESVARVALYYNGNTRQIPMAGMELQTMDLHSPSIVRHQ